MKSDVEKHILVAVAGIVALLFVGIVSLWTHYGVINFEKWGLGDINVLLLISTAGAVLLLLLAICWGRQKSWIILTVFLLGVGILIMSAFIFYGFISNTTDFNAKTGNILKAVGITLTMFAVVIAIFGVFFARKIEKLIDVEKLAEEAPKMATVSAELAFNSLPDFSESHQIPLGLDKMLKRICEPVFMPESPLLKHLDDVGNGAILRYARGLQFFSEGEYPRAIDEFKDALKTKKVDRDTKDSILYRLGITCRQERYYREAISSFIKQYKNAGDKYKKARLQSLYGVALTLYAINQENKNSWKKERKGIAKLVGGIVEGDFSADTPSRIVFDLLTKVVDEQPSNYSAILYLAKFYISNPEWFEQEGVIIDTKELKRLIMELLRFLKEIPDSLNIKASYLMVEATCYLCLSKMGPEEDDSKKEAERALVSALSVTREYKHVTSNKNKTTVFSDEQIRQIDVDDFTKEIRKVASENSIALPPCKSE